MRFLHTADLHLDSAFCKLGALDSEVQRERQRALLRRIFTAAAEHSCDMILISGDLFDTPVVTPETSRLCIELFESFGKPIVIAPGNHDAYVAGGFYRSAQLPENVYVFSSSELQYIDLPELGVSVAGYAFTSAALPSDPLDCPVRPREEGENILLLCAHTEMNVPTSKYAPIMLSDVVAHGFDYAALGHVHNAHALSETVRYCGFPEGRAFDELGDGGAYIVDIDTDRHVSVSRIKTSLCRFEWKEIDLEGVRSTDEMRELVSATVSAYGSDTHLRIELTGAILSEDALDVRSLEASLCASVASLQIIDGTLVLPDVDQLQRDPSLRGAFYRSLSPLLHAESSAERARAQRALRIGLAAIDGASFTDGGRE